MAGEGEQRWRCGRHWVVMGQATGETQKCCWPFSWSSPERKADVLCLQTVPGGAAWSRVCEFMSWMWCILCIWQSLKWTAFLPGPAMYVRPKMYDLCPCLCHLDLPYGTYTVSCLWSLLFKDCMSYVLFFGVLEGWGWVWEQKTSLEWELLREAIAFS